jgi:hypothetical protein
MGCSESNFESGGGVMAAGCFRQGWKYERQIWVNAIESTEDIDKLVSLYEELERVSFARPEDTKNFKMCQNPSPTQKEKKINFLMREQVTHFKGIRDPSKSVVYECMELGKVAGYNMWMKTLNEAVGRGILTNVRKNDIITRRNNSTMPSLLSLQTDSYKTVSPAVSPPTSVTSLISKFNELDAKGRRSGSRVSTPPSGTHRGGGVRLRKNRKSKKRKTRKNKSKKRKQSSRKSKTKRRR